MGAASRLTWLWARLWHSTPHHYHSPSDSVNHHAHPRPPPPPKSQPDPTLGSLPPHRPPASVAGLPGPVERVMTVPVALMRVKNVMLKPPRRPKPFSRPLRAGWAPVAQASTVGCVHTPAQHGPQTGESGRGNGDVPRPFHRGVVVAIDGTSRGPELWFLKEPIHEALPCTCFSKKAASRVPGSSA